MNIRRKFQIGVIGSMADLPYSEKIEVLAEQIGYWIARRGGVVVFGAEKDADSLSSAASRGAKKAGGMTLGVTYNKGLDIFEPADIVIATGLDRGGGREFPFILSCDAVIALNGGSGTLTEIAVAYQANIPVVVLSKTGGWSEKLAGQYLDNRKRIKIETAATPRQAVTRAFQLAEKRMRVQKRNVLFTCCMHGNEPIGYNALKTLEQAGLLSPSDWMIGNPRALQARKRFTDTDLNRIFPGKKKSRLYEERRAAELLEASKKFRCTIDIHGTDADTGIFIIVSQPSIENLLMATILDIPRVVFWPSTSQKNMPFNAAVPVGIEIECGPQKNPAVQKTLQDILKKFLNNFSRFSFLDLSERMSQKELYWVDGKLPSLNKQVFWKEFQKVRFQGKTFYPLLLNRYKDAQCYTMKRVSVQELFHHHSL